MLSEDDSPRLAVVGVGNEIMRDDGVGPRVIEALDADSFDDRDEVRLYDAGTTAFLALEAMSGCEEAIVVDAIDVGESPGSITEYRFADGAFDRRPPEMTMHDVSFTEALHYASDTYDLPERVRIIGVQPDVLEPGLELSDPVADAVSEVTALITQHIRTDGTNGKAIESARNHQVTADSSNPENTQ